MEERLRKEAARQREHEQYCLSLVNPPVTVATYSDYWRLHETISECMDRAWIRDLGRPKAGQ